MVSNPLTPSLYRPGLFPLGRVFVVPSRTRVLVSV